MAAETIRRTTIERAVREESAILDAIAAAGADDTGTLLRVRFAQWTLRKLVERLGVDVDIRVQSLGEILGEVSV